MLKTVTPVGNAITISTAQSKFGGSSALFGGNSSYLTMSSNSDWDFGNGDFTIDFWAMFSQNGAQQQIIFGQSDAAQSYSSISVTCGRAPNNMVYASVQWGAGWANSTTVMSPYGTLKDIWTHVAIIRNSNTFSLYLDGSLADSADIGTLSVNSSGANLSIGRWGEYNGDYLGAFIDEFRISKGIARWVSNFTPPTSPYSPDGYTSLLLHMDGANNSTTFTDSSAETQSISSQNLQISDIVQLGSTKFEVIQVGSNPALLALANIGSRAFDPESTQYNYGLNQWSSSYIRAYLNGLNYSRPGGVSANFGISGSFLSTMSALEQSAIKSVTGDITNDAHQTVETNITDKVRLLGVWEFLAINPQKPLTLSARGTWWTITPATSGDVRYIYPNGDIGGDFFNWNGPRLGRSVVPFLNLESDVQLSGSGTDLDPYVVSAVIDTTPPTATISYSSTAPINGNVTATIVPSEPVTVTNNGGSTSHVFTSNGSFTFEFEDVGGNAGSATATVGNIDKTLPASFSVSVDQPEVNGSNQTALTFTISNATAGYYYNYSISSSGGGQLVESNVVAQASTHTTFGIDVSGLTDGILTLTVSLSGTGETASDTVMKNTSGTVFSQSLSNGDFVFLGALMFRVIQEGENPYLLAFSRMPDDPNFPIQDQNDGAVHFSYSPPSNSWADSAIREYLNGFFLSAFSGMSEAEQNAIKLVTHDVLDNTGVIGTYGQAGVQDKIRLLSIQEYSSIPSLNTPERESWWTLTPYSGGGSPRVLLIYETGAIYNVEAYYGVGFLVPSLNLESYVQMSGLGTYENPYRVADTTPPTAYIHYSNTDPTNNDVTATLVPSESVTVTNNGGSASKVFTSNGSFTFTFQDAAGNAGTATATVSNIDKTAPTATVSYSTTAPTTGNVIATITPSEPVTVTNNGGAASYTFTVNGSFTFEFVDAVGNAGSATATVNNIDSGGGGGGGGDTTPPTATVSYSTTSPTNGNVTATIYPSESVTVTNNGGSTSKVFTSNGSFTFTFQDAAGNTGSATATVNNIDKIAPTAAVSYSTTAPTTGNVIATIAPSEFVIVTNNMGSASKVFTENGSFTFEFQDAAGNTGSVTATVNNIETAPVTSAKEIANAHVSDASKHIPPGGIDGQILSKGENGPEWKDALTDPIGVVRKFANKSIPDGYLLADGSNVDRAIYENLFNAICPAQEFTVTIASPAVFTAENHGLVSGDPVRFETTGALPTYSLGTSMLDKTFYVIASGLSANTFKVSDTLGGTAINTAGSQNGAHTLRSFHYGIGDGSTTFGLPNITNSPLLVGIKY